MVIYTPYRSREEDSITALTESMQSLSLTCPEQDRPGATAIVPHHQQRDSLHLPEEIIAMVLEYLVLDDYADAFTAEFREQLSTLNSISMASKQFHRITQPYLYTVVPVTLNKPKELEEDYKFRFGGSASPHHTSVDCNAAAFLRTLTEHQYLRAHVKHLALARCDTKSSIRHDSGFFCWQNCSDIQSAFSLNRDCDLPHPAVDPESYILEEIFFLLPTLASLDCRAYSTDSPYDALNSDSLLAVGEKFPNIKRVVGHCTDNGREENGIHDLWRWLNLPCIEHLAISFGDIKGQIWYSMPCHTLKHLELSEYIFRIGRYTQEDLIFVALLSSCPNLEILELWYWDELPNELYTMLARRAPRLKNYTCGRLDAEPHEILPVQDTIRQILVPSPRIAAQNKQSGVPVSLGIMRAMSSNQQA